MRPPTPPLISSSAQPHMRMYAAHPTNKSAPHHMSSNAPHLMRPHTKQAMRPSALPPMNSNALTAMRLPMLSNAPQFMSRCALRVATIREVLVTRARKSAPECLRSSATVNQFKDLCRSVPRSLNKTVTKFPSRHL